jgi:hypothetical protein
MNGWFRREELQEEGRDSLARVRKEREERSNSNREGNEPRV